MKYTWPFICLFFGIGVAVCYAKTEAGAIKEAEFVIEKQKKNKANQESRLFFKAPIQTTKKTHKPLAAISTLTLENLPFDPAPETYVPFNLEKKPTIVAFNHYCRLGISSLPRPYVDLSLHNLSFGKGIWSTGMGCIPELWDKKAREGFLCLKGSYGIGRWLLQPSLNYQHLSYKYNHTAPTPTRMLHQGSGSLLVKQASESATQDGEISYHLTDYPNKEINEQLATLQYKWMKRLDNWCLKIATYNDIAKYTNETNQQTRLIVSATPSLSLTLPKAIQLKVGLRMAYHNDTISGIIPNFDLYPMAKISSTVTAWLTTYIGIKGMGVGGSVHPLHLHDLVAKNPFIAPNCKLSHHHQYLKLYVGSKGTALPNVSYHVNIAYRQLKNLSRMVAIEDHTSYRLRYHPQNYNLLKTTGFVNYIVASRKFNAGIKGTYYTYFENRSTPTWWYHKPRWKLKPAITYKPHPKLSLTSYLHLHGSTIVKDIQGHTTQLRRIENISLGGDYFFSKRFAAFLIISNLLNRAYTPYTGYPGKQINITGGIQYRW